MILVIAGRSVMRQLGLAGAAAPGHPGLAALEPSGLSAAGWAHDPDAPGNDRMALGGEIVPASRLTAVITAIDAVQPADLPHVRSDDQGFVAAEMTAFLRSWLMTLDCPVLDRPAALALSGSAGDDAVWSRAAAALGVPDRRHIPVPRLRSHAVTVVGGQVLGQAAEPAATAAIALAAAAGVTAARLTIGDDPAQPALYGAVPWSHAPSQPALHALLAHAHELSDNTVAPGVLSPSGVSR